MNKKCTLACNSAAHMRQSKRGMCLIGLDQDKFMGLWDPKIFLEAAVVAAVTYFPINAINTPKQSKEALHATEST